MLVCPGDGFVMTLATVNIDFYCLMGDRQGKGGEEAHVYLYRKAVGRNRSHRSRQSGSDSRAVFCVVLCVVTVYRNSNLQEVSA